MSRYNYDNTPIIHQGGEPSIRSSASYSTTYSGDSTPRSYRSYSPADTIREQHTQPTYRNNVVVYNNYEGPSDRDAPTPNYSKAYQAKRKS
ncbi:hypothetical protein ACHAQA_004607 [Verticillium albo-atrum]